MQHKYSINTVQIEYQTVINSRARETGESHSYSSHTVAYFGFIVNLLLRMTVGEYYHFLSISCYDIQTLAQIYLNIWTFLHISNFGGLHIHAQFQNITKYLSATHMMLEEGMYLSSTFSDILKII